MAKILHVMRDEKFNDMAIRQFEEVSKGTSEYYVLGERALFTKSPLIRLCTLASLFPLVTEDEVAGVIFHGLPLGHYALLSAVPSEKKVVWIGWGYDYYHLVRGRWDELVLSETKKLLTTSFSQKLRGYAREVVPRRFHTRQKNVKELKRVDIFSPVLDLEFNMIKPRLSKHVQYIEWNYGTAEDDLQQQVTQQTGMNILAGNSATESNNHVDLFLQIRDQVDLSRRKVIVPLSYGSDDYANKVVTVGKELLGDAFVPLLDFLPKQKYMEILRSCGFAIMNHRRQQAVGNVCMAMLMGARVYLRPENPLTEWIRRRGGVIGNAQKLDMKPLTSADQRSNQVLVSSHWGREQQQARTLKLVHRILGSNGQGSPA